jgi:hypothetical protein
MPRARSPIRFRIEARLSIHCFQDTALFEYSLFKILPGPDPKRYAACTSRMKALSSLEI